MAAGRDLGFGMTTLRTTHNLCLMVLNILLKLHVDSFYTLQDIVIFIFGQFGLILSIQAPFGGVFGDITPNP